MSTSNDDGRNHARLDDPTSWPTHIQQRYGLERKAPRRWLVPIVVILAVGLLAGVRYAWRAGTEQGVLTLQAYRVDSAKTVALDLSYVPKARDFTCAVRAQDQNHHDVGFAYLHIKTTQQPNWTYRLTTRNLAASASVLGCQPGLATDRLPPPQFPPGVKPPQQEIPGITPKVNGGFATVRP